MKKNNVFYNIVGMFFGNKREIRLTPNVEDPLLSALLNNQKISAKKAMNIPAVCSCVNLITNTIASIPIKLYKFDVINNKYGSSEVENDNRIKLLNDDTKDCLDGVLFKKSLVKDYLLHGGAYAFINKEKNKIKSLNYVPSYFVGTSKNTNPIFKDYNILVEGVNYRPFEFIKIIRNTIDGINGIGIIDENNELLSVAYQTLEFEKNLVATGGNKKGFINSKNRLSNEAMTSLKDAWKNLYSNNQENVIILNEGLTFQEASNTSVEMQLNQNKNSMKNSIYDIFGVPTQMNEKNYEIFFKQSIYPILISIECALNRDLLLEKEKDNYYFAFDTKEITKSDIKSRFEAYKTALDSNILQIDEIRFLENLKPLGINFMKMGLKDVLYDVNKKEIFTPNTGQKLVIKD